MSGGESKKRRSSLPFVKDRARISEIMLRSLSKRSAPKCDSSLHFFLSGNKSTKKKEKKAIPASAGKSSVISNEVRNLKIARWAAKPQVSK